MQLPPYKSKLLTVAMHKKSIASAMLLLNFCDSVGIRTQDPQLRRLLLYPAELPNRSLLAFGVSAGLIPKVGANIGVFFDISKCLLDFEDN